MIYLYLGVRYIVIGMSLVALVRGIAWIWAMVSCIQGTAGHVNYEDVGPQLTHAAILCGAALLVLFIVLGVI